MDINLLRNGYSPERRKMYMQSPRHNLKSTFEINWQKSFEQRKSGVLERKKQSSNQQTKILYNKQINKRIEEEAKLNKSSFRIMPSSQLYPNEKRYKDSLHHEISNYDRIKKEKQMNESIEEKKFKDLNKVNHHYNTFKKQSYLSLVLGDRLNPYLHTEKHATISFK